MNNQPTIINEPKTKTSATNKPVTWVLGNWKMNPTSKIEAVSLAGDIIKAFHDTKKATPSKQTNLGIAPTALHLSEISSKLAESDIILLAQNVCEHSQPTGAFTGDVSASQLANLGVKSVLIGHSERRLYHHESNQTLANKMTNTIKQGLIAVFCIGETQAEREAGTAEEVVAKQLTDVLDIAQHQAPPDADDFININNFIVAYEPVWAIGTGLSASNNDAQDMHQFIRSTLTKRNPNLKNVSILYGGSVKPQNAANFAACEDVNGVLVGGASLNATDFLDIAKSFG